MPKCSDCGIDKSPEALIGGIGKLVCEDCYVKEKSTMCKSFKNGFEFVLNIPDDIARLERKNGTKCICPFGQKSCSSLCPHFVIENCSIVDKKCCLVLTCGKHLSRVVEIL